MGREKSELEARDRYSRQFAAVLLAEAVHAVRAGQPSKSIVIEAEDVDLWDDIVQRTEGSTRVDHYQVKRQLTPLGASDFEKYLTATTDANTVYHFVFPVFVEVKDLGELRVLRDLITRVNQPGADANAMLKNVRPSERIWITWMAGALGSQPKSVLSRLARVRIDMVGFEEDLDQRALNALLLSCGDKANDAWSQLKERVFAANGAATVDACALDKELPKGSPDKIHEFYTSMVDAMEQRFHLASWEAISDSLVRNQVPRWFYDDLLEFAQSVRSAAWPKRYPAMDAAFGDLAGRVAEYLEHFEREGVWDANERLLREDKSYKRAGSFEKIESGRAKNRRWDQEVQRRLANMVVSLNEVMRQVRLSMAPEYRLRNGRLGLTDSLGIRSHDMVPSVYYPEEVQPIETKVKRSASSVEASRRGRAASNRTKKRPKRRRK